MPSCAEGNIRLRGKRNNLIRFLAHELVSVIHPEEGTYAERPIKIEENQGGWSLILKRGEDTDALLCFHGSNRYFIHMEDDELEIDTSDGKRQNEDQVLFLDQYECPWEIDYEFFRQKAIAYRIDIRTFIWETGMKCSSVTTWYRNGSIDEEKKSYADWLWDSSMPYWDY